MVTDNRESDRARKRDTAPEDTVPWPSTTPAAPPASPDRRARLPKDGGVLWVGSINDVPVAALTRVLARDGLARRLCLANVDGKVYAFEDACPHRRARLSEGRLTGNVVQCPAHGWQFNVRSGAYLGPGSRRLTRFAVKSRNGELTIASGPLRHRTLLGLRRFLLPRLRHWLSLPDWFR
jgi:nitrite reductase/ring-hydroxylating ferredoxin subunit